jgi:phosphatidylserine decarboxylase
VKIVFIIFQYLLPQQCLSRLVGRLAECTTPWLKNALIKRFIRHYGVDMSEAAEPDPELYSNFNAFFTRALKEGARPIAEGSHDIACPADGVVSQLGKISAGRILQAKGQDYSLNQLLAGDQAMAAQFIDGHFATIYLSPKDYHRVHMPLDGELRSSTYVPGQLFSVNQTTADNVANLFARNERLISVFDTDAGPMAVILVGAMIVAGIETVWTGQIAPPPRQISTQHYPRQEAVSLKKGEEMGRFKLGSTVILLFGKDQVEWASQFGPLSPTRLGEPLGSRQIVSA